mmetsp:Transcript_49133/g.96878  ORF Transcript_49133/g.96878 Transcript_49133/m.96878 type:complete len:82 (+) Transcript_49133:207-452(+)
MEKEGVHAKRKEGRKKQRKYHFIDRSIFKGGRPFHLNTSITPFNHAEPLPLFASLYLPPPPDRACKMGEDPLPLSFIRTLL